MIPACKQTARIEKSNKALKEIAKSNFDDPNDTEAVELRLKTMNPMNVYKKMDTSVEGFFAKREYNRKNFNFLLTALAEKADLDGAHNILELMKGMSIEADPQTYNAMIKACSKKNSMPLAEEYFEKSVQRKQYMFGASLFNYTSLLVGYARNKNVKEAERIVREMKEKGLQIDAPVYTTLINANYKARNLTRCWSIYEDLKKTNPNMIDIPMRSFMIEIASHTRDAEKGRLIWEELDKLPSFYPSTVHCNNIIKCLGSRNDYADEAIEHWQKMKEMGIQPDEDTFVALFKACANAGDVKTAFDGMQVMKAQGITMNKYILNQAIRVYSGVVKADYMTTDLVDMYIADAWKLFEHAVAEGLVDIHIINSLLDVHVKAAKESEIDGLVLPLFEKYNIKKSTETFESLMELFYEKRDLPKIYRMHGWLLSEKLEESWKILNYLLDTAYRAEDVNVMCDVLKKLLAAKKEPRTVYLKRLGENKNTPDQIFVLLAKFPQKYGYVADQNYKPPVKGEHVLNKYQSRK